MSLLELRSTSRRDGQSPLRAVSFPARLHPAVLVLVLFQLTGCGSQFATRHSLTRQAASTAKKTADLLSTIKDKASAEAAAPQLKRLCDRMDKLTERFEAIDTEDAIYLGEQEAAILEEHGRWIAEQTRLMQEEYRIGQIPEARAALGDVWIQLTGGAFDPGGPLASGGVADMGAGLQPDAGPAGGIVPADMPRPKQPPAAK